MSHLDWPHWFPINLPKRYRHRPCHPWPEPPAPVIPPSLIEAIDAEVIKILEEQGLLPIPTPGGSVFYIPDYANSVVTSIPLDPNEGAGLIGEFTYTVPANGFVSVSGLAFSTTDSITASITIETNGILIDAETSNARSATYIVTKKLPVEAGAEIKAVFSSIGTTSGTSAFQNMFMIFYPLKSAAV